MLVISQDFSFISQVFSFHIKIGSDKFLKAIVDTSRKKKIGFQYFTDCSFTFESTVLQTCCNRYAVMVKINSRWGCIDSTVVKYCIHAFT